MEGILLFGIIGLYKKDLVMGTGHGCGKLVEVSYRNKLRLDKL